MINLKLPKEQKTLMIERLQDYFYEERAEELGDLPAELMLDHMIKLIGPLIYNKAVEDTLAVVRDRMVSLEDDLHALKKQQR